MPVLDGAPGFTLLAISIGLAAYLRQVSAAARDKIETVITNNDPFWNISNQHSKTHIEILTSTRNIIKFVTHLFFFFASGVAIRMALYAWTTCSCPSGHCSGNSFQLVSACVAGNSAHLLDAVLITFPAVAIPGMWFAHWRSRRKDDANFGAMLKFHLQNASTNS